MEQQVQKRSSFRTCKFETRAEEREQGGGKKLVLRGYPILFNTETEVYDSWYGQVRETILPTALEGTDLSDVYLLVGHNPNEILGRSSVNMRVEVDKIGVFIECELPNTQLARDIYNLVENGILDGMSFGFYCSDMVNPETLTRTITHIDELLEFTVTPFPAYKETCIIAKNNETNAEAKNDKPNGDTEDAGDDNSATIKELEDLLND